MSEEIKNEIPAEESVTAVAERPAAELAERAEAGLPVAAEAPVDDVVEELPVEVIEETAEDQGFTMPEAEVEVDIKDDRDEEADSLINWGAARAGVIVVAPLLGTLSLIANEVYMISKIGAVYDVKLADKAALSFLGSLGATVTGSLAATLIPIPFMQVPIAVGVTYGVGKAAKKWIKDGMPDDVKPYLAVFEEEKEKGEENVEEIEKNPLKDEPLGDETADVTEGALVPAETTAEEMPKKKLYPEEAHEAFDKISGKLADAAGLASARFIEALKKAGVTEEQIEKAKYTAIGISEVARETAIDAAKEFSAQAKVKSAEWKEQAKEKSKDLSAQAKEKSKDLSVQAKEKSKDISEQAKEKLDELKSKGKKLRLEADVRAAEAKVQAEKAKAEARIRMAQAKVKSANFKVQAGEQADEARAQAEAAKAKALEFSEKMKAQAKAAAESAKKAAEEAKENFRNAAGEFKSKALERADQRRAEARAETLGKSAPCDEPPVEPAAEPVASEVVEEKE